MTARFSARHLVLLAALVMAGLFALRPAPALAGPCDAPVNVIACENSKPGSPESEWQIGAAGDDTIQGYATPMSVVAGQTVTFKVNTDASDYTVDIYRLGWYGGDGARKVAVVEPTAQLPQNQPACITDPPSGLADCGNWAPSASWRVPADAVSGVYIARLVRTDTGGDSHMVFVVRDDTRHADILYQTSDTTWQAYNTYGGPSLYPNASYPWHPGRGYKVSYNRPIITREYNQNSTLFNGEYPMIRWLERNGYDVSYSTGVDTASRGSELLNHKIFMTAGHDEYWSNEQRNNVENARDHGVDIAFFSGNNIYWKTRWENSIDGTSTPFRTMVSYKESTEETKEDPTNTWTGTWRDPLGAAWDGHKPENALVGNIFTVNAPREDTLEVPYRYSRVRLWRNTDVQSLQPGQTASFTPGMLGHEWNEDLDNGYRPPGTIDMSSSTYQVDNKVSTVGGADFAQGTATHKLTLYRAPSGALVFGAGTVQWAWGLDDHHDKDTPAPDPRIQQATANLLADMGTEPTTAQAGLVVPQPSGDTTPPATTITSPSAGASIRNGDAVPITGKATDQGGVVAGVEVSTDGGSTWHPADIDADGQTVNWTYDWHPTGGFGPVTIKARSTDDSANIEQTPASVGVQLACPCNLWGNSVKPGVLQSGTDPFGTLSSSDTGSVELGVKFQSSVAGWVTGIRFYKGTNNTGTHVGSLWTTGGTLLARVKFTGESATGWQQASFDQPVQISANTTYVASYHAPNGGYPQDKPYFDSAYAKAPLSAPASDAINGNGVYTYNADPVFPDQTLGAANYWVDVAFTDTVPPDTTPPTVTSVTPSGGSTGADPRGNITAEFSEGLDASTVTGSTFTLKDASGTSVAATVSYDAGSRSAILQTNSAMAYSATYTATVKGGANGVKDRAGNPLAADKTWSFTVAAPPTCPCSLFPAGAAPAQTATNETSPLEVGVRFKADADGFITAIKYYRATGNNGGETVNLWTGGGTLLARVAAPAGNASGWQQIALPNPVPVTADATYVASYFSPTGNFAVDRGYFRSAVSNAPLRTTTDGPGNGVYRYGTSTGFPDSSYNASNYWVDVVYRNNAPSDTTPPTVDAVSPAAGSTTADARGDVTARFSEAIDQSTLTTSTFTLTDASGTAVQASVSWDALSRTATLHPASRLAYATTYTATVKGGATGVKDTSGNALAADRTWSFTTAAAPNCPCTLFSAGSTPATANTNETLPIEVGVRFQPDQSGYITAIRFYKAVGSTDADTVNLWTDAGRLLARADLPAGAAPGWQQVPLPSPVAVDADTVYVASYFSPSGNFAVDRAVDPGGLASQKINPPLRTATGGNGVYRYGSATGFPDSAGNGSNYWVDAVYMPTLPPDTAPPEITTTTPSAGANGVDVQTAVTATFDEGMDPASIGGSTVQLQSPGGGSVAAAVSYDAASRTATLRPSSPLAFTTTYTATVKGGASGVKDLAGNPLAADKTWSFTTVAPRACPCSLWNDFTMPTTTSVPDTDSIELGVRFQADVDGTISAVRFYKGLSNTGPHDVSLWTSNGTLLARATAVNESLSGWQTVTLAQPVAITAGTTYVASYHAPAGGFAVDRAFFVNPVDNSPLRAPDATQGGNGVYTYSAGDAFPADTYNASNYWVDVVFNRNGG